MEVRFVKVGLRLVCCALLLLAESAGSTRNAMHGRAMRCSRLAMLVLSSCAAAAYQQVMHGS